MAATPKRAVRLIGAPVDLANGIGGAYLGPSALRRTGLAVAGEALIRALDGTDGFHLNIDMDALDPEAAPGVSYPVPGGLTFGEARVLMQGVALSGGLRSLDLGELNPLCDTGNRTARAAAELIAAAFGETTPPRPQ